MRILFDIVHPADVLFFLRPIRALEARGHDVLVCSREKDIACDLLDEFGIEHEPVSTASDSKVGAAFELLLRDAAVAGLARRFKPHAMVGFGGVSIAHAGALLGIPSIAFYDTENASLQTRLTYPAITKLYVPDSYLGDVPEKKTVRVPGVKELSYLHPEGFTADRRIAVENGLDPDRKNVFIRLVAWRANHDWGKAGWSLEELCAVVDRFRREAQIHISSEVPLPATMQKYAFSGTKADVHHVMGHCDLYVGESATMASEAAILGVRSVFAGRDHLGYITELSDAGLVTSGPLEPDLSLAALVEQQMQRSDSRVKADWSRYVVDKPDWSKIVLGSLAPYAPVQRGLGQPDLRRTA